MERFNGTLRERAKVQTGWKSHGIKIAEGQKIQYDFVKPHAALEGQTPAERAGMDLNLEGNRWMQLIRAAKAS